MALLALESASRIGAKVPSKAYVAALELLVGWQAQTGAKVTLKMNQIRGADRWEWPEKAQARGFAFGGSLSDEPTGYETAAGAMGLVVCQDALQKDRAFTKDLRKQARDGIRDAMAWIQEHFDVAKNPYTAGGKRHTGELGSELFQHHWLQALARLSIHARIRFYGTHDWYQEGAQELLRTQREDGSWASIWWSNCYALLFLMRASLTSTAPVFTVSENDPGK
jgi:hypothetical protein